MSETRLAVEVRSRSRHSTKALRITLISRFSARAPPIRQRHYGHALLAWQCQNESNWAVFTLTHLGPGFLEPQPHAHFVEQAHRRREMLRRLPIAYSPAELAEAEAAVSDERAHAELQGQSRGSGVVGFGRRHVRAVAM